MNRIPDSFTQRLLLRASQRRNRGKNNGAQGSSKETLQRRAIIIKAINEPFLSSTIQLFRDDNNNNVSFYVDQPQFSQTPKVVDNWPNVVVESNENSFLNSTELSLSRKLNETFVISTNNDVNTSTDSNRTDGSQSTDEVSISKNSEIFDEDEFLKNALGDELNNTSVTYDDSLNEDRTNSDFEASDLMSDCNDSMETNMAVDFDPPLSEFKPLNTSTLNRSTKLDRSSTPKIAETKISSVSKWRVVPRFFKKLRRNFKNVVGCTKSSER